MATEIKKIISRRDTAAKWEANNPILAQGEIGVDTTNQVMKIGDGVTPWKSLKGVVESHVVNDLTTGGADEALSAEMGKELSRIISSINPIIINGNVTNAADEEDITSEDNLLKLKDRSALYGMGYVILRRNKSFKEQLTQSNTIYEIRYNFDLGDEEVEIPENCVLKFEGGSIRNGKIIFNETTIKSKNDAKLFENCELDGKILNSVNIKWFGAGFGSNDAPIINNLINVCNNSLHIPAGEYNIEESIILDSQSLVTKIFGDGKDNTKIKAKSCTAFVVKKRIEIQGINIRGNEDCLGHYNEDTKLYEGGYYGFDVQKGCYISDCNVGRFATGANVVNGVIVTLTIHGCTFDYNSNFGIDIRGNNTAQKNNIVLDKVYCVFNGRSVDNKSEESTELNSGHGLQIQGCYDLSVTNSVFEYNSGCGIRTIKPLDTSPFIGLGIKNNYFERNKFTDLFVETEFRPTLFNKIYIGENSYSRRGNMEAPNAQSQEYIIQDAWLGAYGAKSIDVQIENNKFGADYERVKTITDSLLNNFMFGYNFVMHDGSYYINQTSSISKIGHLSTLLNKGRYKLIVESYHSMATAKNVYFQLSNKSKIDNLYLTKGEGQRGYKCIYIDIDKDNTYLTIGSNYIDGGLGDSESLLIKYSIEKTNFSEERPILTMYDKGVSHFDIELSKPIWWTGEKWVDATGTEV